MDYAKKYYQDHKEQILVNNKIYKLMNIDKVIEANRIYKEKHYEKLHEPFKCECGGKYTFNSRAKHFKTKKHLAYLALL